jgi:uncharacterized Zn-binding protein involved in type VI secretion
MPTGHFLRKGDKTTCGGSILSGSSKHSFGGVATARNGDSVSCGKDGKIYHIAGGNPDYWIHGVAAAGTLHSRSTCPCRARFISSFPNASYWIEEEKAVRAVSVASPLAETTSAKAEEPIQHAQVAKKHNNFAETCKPEDNPLLDGVYIWVEVQEAGHAFVSVHQNNQVFVYTYGRFGRVGTAGLTGDGILLFMKGDDARLYYREELYLREAEVFKINDVGLFSARDAFQKLWDKGTQPIVTKGMGDRTKRNGRVIDEYDITGSNCTTHTINAITEAGSHIFETVYNSITTGIPIKGREDFTIPVSLKKYLTEKSSDLSTMDVLKITNEFKAQYPNINGWGPSKSDGYGKTLEAATEILSEAGSSTGYSAGSTGGLLGGSLNVE